jgi:hypothetical protein
MALSIIFPFWGVWLTATAKQKLDTFLAEVLVQFRKRASDSGKESYGDQVLADSIGSMGFYSDLFDDFWTQELEPLYNAALVCHCSLYWVGLIYYCRPSSGSG